MRKLLAFLLLAACGATAAAFDPTKTPVSPDGTKAVIDLPASQHMRNVGGSDGLGLCVFTSIQHAGYWQNLRSLDGFRRWMESQPGGGYPQKVDTMLSRFCKQRGVDVPPYIQHTGGDADFLELALHTDRIVCVTYAGRDDFYRGRIAHMVNLAHLDAKTAAIIDNNRPGYWVWMTRAEFLDRWRDMQGGWAIVFLDPPPPSYPDDAKEAGGCRCKRHKPGEPWEDNCGEFVCPTNGGKGKCSCCEKTASGCICGDDCKCKPGDCPRKCPVVFGQRCGTGGCGPVGPLSYPSLPATPAAPAVIDNGKGQWLTNANGREWGFWIGGKCTAAAFADGRCEAVDERGIATGKAIDPPAPLPFAIGHDELPTGVVADKIHTHPEYSLSGRKVTKAEAMQAMAGGISDDSGRWHLSAVGDDAFLSAFKKDVAALPADVRGKLLVQAYAPDRWEVSQFKLAAGVTLRKPSPVRTSATVVTVAASDYSAVKLGGLLAAEGGPSYVKPAPKPPEPVAPPVKPAPVDPKPNDGPDKTPTP